MDGWVEEIKPRLWMQAFEECGVVPERYLRERTSDEALPWDHISCDIPKRYFLKEWERALSMRTTPDCLKYTCSTCGACDYDATRNVLFATFLGVATIWAKYRRNMWDENIQNLFWSSADFLFQSVCL